MEYGISKATMAQCPAYVEPQEMKKCFRRNWWRLIQKIEACPAMLFATALGHILCQHADT